MNRHLLIVDDSPVMRTLLSEVFRGEFDVATAGDGVAALEHLLTAEPVDAIVLDLSMPRMGGVEFLKRMRRMPAFEDVPVVVVSGHYESLERINAIEAGADDFLTKPFNPLELKLRVARLLPAERTAAAAGVGVGTHVRRSGLAQVVKLVRRSADVG